MAARAAPSPVDAAALAQRMLAAAVESGPAITGCSGPLPSSRDVAALVDHFLEALFPGAGHLPAPEDARSGAGLAAQVASIIEGLAQRLDHAVCLGLDRRASSSSVSHQEPARAVTARLLDALPEIRAALSRDVEAAYQADPAATCVDEILACYPGLYAVAVYRVANRLLREGAAIVPRMMTEHAHSRTGIDIHPGATIGPSFFIDHGTGTVIGETTVIGSRVRVYQGVTLGAHSVKHRAETPAGAGVAARRHPTIEDDVVIYSNATILGGDTVIGRGAVIGGNAWITYSVPAGVRVG